MNDEPTIARWAADHIAWPTICGWRVIRMTPVSHRWSFGFSTAATSFRLKTDGYRKKKDAKLTHHAIACAVGFVYPFHSTTPSWQWAMK